MKKVFLILSVLFLMVACGSNGETPIEKPEPPTQVQDPFKERSFHADGVWYDLPIKLQDLVDNGWVPDIVKDPEAELNATLKPNTYMPKYLMRKGRLVFSVTLQNFTDSEIKRRDGIVTTVTGENRESISDNILDFEVDKKITLKTTQEELKTLWGEPTEISTPGGMYEIWRYKHNDNADSEIYWDTKTNTIFRFTISNVRELKK